MIESYILNFLVQNVTTFNKGNDSKTRVFIERFLNLTYFEFLFFFNEFLTIYTPHDIIKMTDFEKLLFLINLIDYDYYNEYERFNTPEIVERINQALNSDYDNILIDGNNEDNSIKPDWTELLDLSYQFRQGLYADFDLNDFYKTDSKDVFFINGIVRFFLEKSSSKKLSKSLIIKCQELYISIYHAYVENHLIWNQKTHNIPYFYDVNSIINIILNQEFIFYAKYLQEGLTSYRLSDGMELKLDYSRYDLSNYAIQSSYNIDKNNKSVLIKLYSELERKDFIDIEKTTLKYFLNVILKDWGTHASILHLEMDNIQTKLLFDLMKSNLNIHIPLKKAVEAKNIKNKNGFLKLGSMKTSTSKSLTLPKRYDDIIAIIQNTRK